MVTSLNLQNLSNSRRGKLIGAQNLFGNLRVNTKTEGKRHFSVVFGSTDNMVNM